MANAVLLLGAAAVPLLGYLMAFDPSGGVRLPGLEKAALPTLCPSRWFGFRCLTCGATRSVIALMHGDRAASFALHPFGWLILAQIVAQIPYRAFRLVRPEIRLPALERLAIAAVVTTLILSASARFLEGLGR